MSAPHALRAPRAPPEGDGVRSRTSVDLLGRCARCFLRDAYCLCGLVPRIETRTRFVVIRHFLEAWKTTNTARLAALALTNSEIRDYGVKGQPFDASVMDAPDTWLLYPDDRPQAPFSTPPARLLIVDGSWHQARKILRSNPRLWTLPKISLPPPPPEARRLRAEHFEQGMSTIEAIARAVALFEGEAKARQLDELHEVMIERILALRGRPGPAA
jgi:DTW domain-containing protein YfiP